MYIFFSSPPPSRADAALLGLLGELGVDEVTVEAGLGHEGFVRPDLYDLALVHSDGLVRAFHGGQAMGDDDGGPVLHYVDERILDEGLVLRVE